VASGVGVHVAVGSTVGVAVGRASAVMVAWTSAVCAKPVRCASTSTPGSPDPQALNIMLNKVNAVSNSQNLFVFNLMITYSSWPRLENVVGRLSIVEYVGKMSRIRENAAFDVLNGKISQQLLWH
jgi:hypothetical protein